MPDILCRNIQIYWGHSSECPRNDGVPGILTWHVGSQCEMASQFRREFRCTFHFLPLMRRAKNMTTVWIGRLALLCRISISRNESPDHLRMTVSKSDFASDLKPNTFSDF
jgi:hypothetical protein